MKDHIYYRTMWSHIVAFADTFNDLKCIIYEKTKDELNYGKPIGMIKVPIILAPKEKVLSLLNVGAGDRPEVDNLLPKVSIIMSGLKLDSDRLRGMHQQRDLMTEYRTSTSGKKEAVKHYDMQTVPYKMDIDMTIWAKYMDQAVQMLENILPYFSPDLTLSIVERGLGTERKSKVELNSVTPNFVYELNEPDRRIIQYNLSFTMEVNLYKPIYIDKPIHEVTIRVATLDTNNPRLATGESIIVAASGADLFGIDPIMMSRIMDLDQITPASGTITAGNTVIAVNSWALNVAQTVQTFDTSQGFSSALNPGEINDEHNPTIKYLYPVARHMGYKYNNEFNPDNKVIPDPTAEQEYIDWIKESNP